MAVLIPRDQDELYRLCEADGTALSPGEPHHPFHGWSEPYLVATELPWKVLGAEAVKGRSVWCVAGSGDVPLFFSSLGAGELLAFDISRPACFLNELKRAAVRTLPWEQVLAFFLSGLDRAKSFLEARSIAFDLPRESRLEWYVKMRENLSLAARRYWDPLLAAAGTSGDFSPFQRFVRGTDLFLLEEIPHLASPDVFSSWKETCRDYPIMNLPWEQTLDAVDGLCEVLYLSNVLEYGRQSYLEQDDPRGYAAYLEHWLSRIAARLAPSGELYVYVFHGEGSAPLKQILGEFEDAHQGRFRIEVTGLRVRSALLCNSLFRHALVKLGKRD